MSDYTHSNATITASNKINQVYPVNEKLTEDYIHKLITDDVLSVKAQKGKIPVADPETGMIDGSWLGIDPNASYAVDATTARKGIIEIATNAEAITGTDTERAVTPAGVKASIDNSFTTNKATTTQAGTVILSNLIDNSQDKAVTPYAVKNYLASSNFARAGYNVTGVTPYASVTNVSGIISESKTKPINTLKNDTRYKEVAVDPYSLYNYISNNDMYLNVNRQSVGGIIFRELVENDSGTKVTATEKARLYVNKDTGNTYLKIGSKTLTLLDTAGNTTVPTSVITPVIKNSSGDAPKLGTKQIGSASQPVYIASDGTITKCNTIDNVNNAVTASKLGSSTVGSTTQAIYLNSGVPTAIVNKTFSNALINSLDTGTSTPKDEDYIISQYAGGGTTNTNFYRRPISAVYSYIKGKTDSLYLPLTGGTITGGLNIYTDKTYTSGSSNGLLNIRYKSTKNTNMSSSIVDVIGTDSSDGYNTPVSIGSSNGTTQIGAGESRRGFLGARTLYNNENLYLTADGTINIYPGISNDNATYGGPLTISSAKSTDSGGKVNITGVNTIDGKAANVTGTVAIANGGTGATTRLAAVKALTNENVGTNATYFLTITDSWGMAGYSSLANVKNILGLSNYLPLSGGTVTGSIFKKNSSVTRGTAPSSNSYMTYGYQDSAGRYIGVFESGYYTDKSSKTAMYAYNTTIAKGNNIGSVGIGCDTSGNVYTFAPTPATGDNSTKIATTAFVKTALSSAGVGKVTFANGSTTNGWVALNSGLILQWGVVASARNQKIMFHKAINVFSIVSIPLSDNDTRSDGFSHHVKSYTTTYFISFNEHSHQDRIFWMALGSPA